MTATKARRAHWGQGHWYRDGRGNWCIRYYTGEVDDGGRRTRRVFNSGTANRTAAKRLGRQVLAERDRRLADAEGVAPPRPTASQLKKDPTYEETRDYLIERKRARGQPDRVRTKHLDAFFAGLRWSEMRRHLVEAYVDHRREAGASWSTVQKEIADLRRMMNVSLIGELLDHSFRVEFKELIPAFDNARESVWEHEEFVAVYEKLAPHHRPIFEFGYLMGWRLNSEVLSLNYEHVDLDAGVIFLPGTMTKERKPRAVPLAPLPQLARLLRDQAAYTKANGFVPVGKQPLFHHPSDYRIIHERGQRIRDFYGPLRRACEAAKVPYGSNVEGGKVYHDLRRTVETRYQRLGTPPDVITLLTGHQTIQMQRRYTVMNRKDVALYMGMAAEAIPEYQPKAG